MRKILRLWTRAWPTAAAGAFVAVIMSMRGVTAIDLAAVRVTMANPWRPLALAAVFAGIEFFVARHQRRRLVLPACALIFSFVLAIILISRSAPQVAAFADGALFEVHTRNALQGQQALGAYSQFGWSHPGPLAFYVFGPLYQLGGASQFSLNSAAFTINVLALLLTVALAIRYGDGALPPILAAWLLLYLLRLPDLASSFWNPHFLVLPLAALLVTCAAVSVGHHWAWPVVALLGSWVAQAHIGLLPAVAGCCGVSVALSWISTNGRTPRSTKWLVVLILAAAWALPIADQLINSPGNMRRIAHFFLYESGPRPGLAVSLKAFAAMTTGVLQPNLYLAQGWLFEPVSWGPVAALLIGVPALAIATWTEWRSGARFNSALGAVCLSTLAMGLLSAISIRGRVGDYHLFWLTVVGAVSAAVVTTAVVRRFISLPSALGVYAGAAAFAVALYASYGALMARTTLAPTSERTTVMGLTKDIMDQQRTGQFGRLLIEVDPLVWDIAAGVVLELVKADVEVHVDPLLVRLYGPPFRASGDEDTLLSIAGPAKQEAVMKQDGRLFVTSVNRVSVSVRRIPPLGSFLTVR